MLESLTMVRHGESAGNAALAGAITAGAEESGLGLRDSDIPLSDLGRAQAGAVGKWLARQWDSVDAVLCSPYVRALETAEIALRAGRAPAVQVDERLRDREQGLLGGLTELGVQRRYPAEAAARELMGRFYYRPPGGEAWTDVALRLRTLLPELEGHVLVFAHDLVIVMVRYILDDLDESTILKIESNQLANASISRWERDHSGLRLLKYNDVGHLQ
ncbi:histidine phosphatase family protein [Nocardia sp. NPDC006630]|uniref:histidine phosphatase family protein n=1 Tax=Nocardia sp. NPDC006630 TaxID=3157181 RepID=UPI0033BA8BDF